jgi:hypothetical protein
VNAIAAVDADHHQAQRSISGAHDRAFAKSADGILTIVDDKISGSAKVA